jgi:hypothetical protein
MIQEMEKMSLLNEKLLISQMSLLMDDDSNTQMAVEYCLNKLKNFEKHQIKAKKVFHSNFLSIFLHKYFYR